MDRILRDKKFSERVSHVPWPACSPPCLRATNLTPRTSWAPPQTASHYFRSMAAAIQHCHKNHVVHRDLKPENFLFASDSEDAELKLTDFGLSHYIETMDSVIHDVRHQECTPYPYPMCKHSPFHVNTHTQACGSAYYIAPEVFTRHYTRSADVWSLGVILYLLLSGTVPFGYDVSPPFTESLCAQRLITLPLPLYVRSRPKKKQMCTRQSRRSRSSWTVPLHPCQHRRVSWLWGCWRRTQPSATPLSRH